MEEQTNEFAINTCNVVQLLKEQCDKFSIEQLLDFRERLETTLIIYHKVYEKFHPLRWRYFRQKYLDAYNQKWRKTNDGNKHNIFKPIYFMHDTVRIERISIDSLTDDERIQIIAPLRENTSIEEQRPSIRITRASEDDITSHISPRQSLTLIEIKRDNTFKLMNELKAHKTLIFEDLSKNERKEILKRLPTQSISSFKEQPTKSSYYGGNRKLVNSYNDNDPYDWSRWEYDLYLIDSHCLLSIYNNRDDYEFFFAWQLALTDYFEIESFLQQQFEHSFLGEVEVFKKFIKILFKTYKHILSDSDNKEIVFEYFDNLKEIEEVIIDIEKTEDIENEGTITIDLPKFPRAKFRTKTDDLTCLTRERTALLVDTLRQVKVFLSEDIQPNTHAAKAIQVLTGYSHNKLRTDLTANYKKEDLVATQEILQKAIDLINKKLKKK